jgi:purine nucleoside permease
MNRRLKFCVSALAVSAMCAVFVSLRTRTQARAAAGPASSAPSPNAAPIPIKVVVISMFERGQDSGDAPGEYQFWVEREHLDQIIDVPAAFHHVRLNKDGVLGMLTGVGTARAAASVTAVGLDPRFDFSHAYWIVAGIGGGDPTDVSLGSAVWADHVLDSDLAYEIDSREIPKNWPTGYVPMNKGTPYEQPYQPDPEYMLFTLNPKLVMWAFRLTQNISVPDTPTMRAWRSRFTGFSNAQKLPFVTHGDAFSGGTFWHGTLLSKWANDWTRYFLGPQANYMVTAQEDTGTLQALTFLSHTGRVDMNRVLVLRTISNYDREPPGMTPAESLNRMATGNYPAFIPSLEEAYAVGDKVVRNIVDHWGERESKIPGSN